MKKLLVDLGSSLKLQLTESYQDGKFLVAKGEFGRADTPTQNRRVYPRSIWDREIRNINEAMRAGKVLGELDHPQDGKTSLKRVSHLMCGLYMTEDGLIIGEARVLNNEYGKQLRSILEAGGAIGVSSRGMGSTAMGENGSEIVQDDYQYMTHDFVADPAVLTSYPKFQTEVRWIAPETVVTETKESSMAKKTEEKAQITEASNLNADEQKIANHLAGHPEIIQKVKAAKDPVQELGALIDPHSLGVDANAQYELSNVLDHYNIRHESKAVEPKEVKTEDKAQDNNEPPKVQEPNEVKAPEAKVEEAPKEELPPVAESPAVEEKKEANVKTESVASVEVKPSGDVVVTGNDVVVQESKALASEIVLENIKKLMAPFILPEDFDKALAKKDEQILELKKVVEFKDKQIAEFGGVANRLAAQLHFERKMSEAKEDRDDLVKIIGKQKLESVQHVDKVLAEAKKQLESRKEEKKLLEMEAKRLEAKYESKLKATEEKAQKLEEALKSTVAYSKEIGMQLYIEQKVRGNPNAMKIRKLCEGKTERKEVDSIIERFSVAPSVNEEYNAIKRRFEKFKNTTLVEDQIRETGAERSQSQTDKEGVLGEMTDLFPGATLDQVEALM